MKKYSDMTSREKFDYAQSEKYKNQKLIVMSNFSPQIYPCKKCGSPVASGYICQWCGETEPYNE